MIASIRKTIIIASCLSFYNDYHFYYNNNNRKFPTTCDAWNINPIVSKTTSTFHKYKNEQNYSNKKQIFVLHSTSKISSRTTTTNANNNDKKVRLSRPERKALERKQKEELQKNKNKKNKNHNIINAQKIVLDVSTLRTSEEIMHVIKKAQQYENVNDIDIITSLVLNDLTSTNDVVTLSNNAIISMEDMESILSRLLVAILFLSLDNESSTTKICLKRNEYIIHNNNENNKRINRPKESAAIIRSLLRNCNSLNDKSFHNVMSILNNELSYDDSSTTATTEGALLNDNDKDKNYTIELLKYGILSLSSLLIKYLLIDLKENSGDNNNKIVSTCNDIVQLYTPIQNILSSDSKEWKLFHKIMPYKRIMQAASTNEIQRRSTYSSNIISSNDNDTKMIPSNIVYSILDIILTYIPTTTSTAIVPNKDSQELYEMLNNALIRRTVFMLGVVNINQLPKQDRGEVVFIGRSNVGKSSLVNMITNRKSLAFTSKQPGKTQQFNYFAINDIPDLQRTVRYGDEFPDQQKDKDSFYLVDIPGYGYAHGISKEQKNEWITLLNNYITVRHKTLKVIFHLIDSRIGITTDDDLTIMKLMSRIGYALAMLTREDVPYLKDLEVVLGRKVIYDNNDTNKDTRSFKINDMKEDDVHFGTVPENVLSGCKEILENNTLISSHSYEVYSSLKSCNNAMIQYRKSRVQPSSYAIKQSKSLLNTNVNIKINNSNEDINTNNAELPIHSLFYNEKYHSNVDYKSREDFLRQMRAFSPNETILEMTSSVHLEKEKKNEGIIRLMERRRKTIQRKQSSYAASSQNNDLDGDVLVEDEQMFCYFESAYYGTNVLLF